ncbi:MULTISPECIES: hypothetical protein [Sporosarcina]|uniref:Uncharacterized protein n=1 Tax=Sporosarcina contaminans TaxID=633403 RepID=A0ABW3U2R9_9BACL
MTRVFLFLISYGIIVVTVSNMILYLNYLSLGYTYQQIFMYILQTADFALFVMAVIVLNLTVFFRFPSLPPFS